MTVWVFRDGELVEKYVKPRQLTFFPMPQLSRIEPFESPVTGKEISSWRERDRDMAAAGAYDPRDLKDHVYPKGRAAQAKETG